MDRKTITEIEKELTVIRSASKQLNKAKSKEELAILCKQIMDACTNAQEYLHSRGVAVGKDTPQETH